MAMTRREAFRSALAGGAIAASARAQTPAAPQAVYRKSASCLPDYLRTLAADVYPRLKARIAALNTPAAIREYRGWARATVVRLAGGAAGGAAPCTPATRALA